MFVTTVILQSLLILYYGFSGVAKIIGAKYWTDMFKHLGLPQWFRVVTGCVQLIGAAVLIIGYWFEGAVAWAGIWLGITMILAYLAHVRVKDPFSKASPALVFALVNIIVIILTANHMLHVFS